MFPAKILSIQRYIDISIKTLNYEYWERYRAICNKAAIITDVRYSLNGNICNCMLFAGSRLPKLKAKSILNFKFLLHKCSTSAFEEQKRNVVEKTMKFPFHRRQNI